MKTISKKDNSQTMTNSNSVVSAAAAQKKSGDKVLQDNRPEAEIQMKMADIIQKTGADEEELMQGKFIAQMQGPEDEELMQG